MKSITLILIVFTLGNSLFAQTKNQIIGTWKLSYSLQPNKKMCELAKGTTKITFNTDSSYYWDDYGAIKKGKWKILDHKIRFYDTRAVNFKGTLSDVSYKIEVKGKSLIFHLPEGVEIPCPHQFFIKVM